MILKMSHTNQETGRKGWSIYDNIVQVITGYNPGEGCSTLCVFFKGEDTYNEYPIRDVAYLCNDEGKTIEAFYPDLTGATDTKVGHKASKSI